MENKKLQKQLHQFRMIGLAEGVSFMVLLLIAMPLKYFLDIPEAVKFVGWAHGILFMGFIYYAFEMMRLLNKKNFWFAKAFAAAIVPLGTFLFDKELKKKEQELSCQ